MFDKNRHKMAEDRRNALKKIGVVGAGLSLPISTASITAAESSETTNVSTQSTSLDDDYTLVVDSANTRHLELSSDVELHESFESETGDTIFIIHIGSCTRMWAEWDDGSTSDIPLIYNEWHEIDFSNSNVKNGYADDRENWVGAHEVTESLDSDIDYTLAEVSISGALAGLTASWATTSAIIASMAYAYLSSSSETLDVHTNYWNWNEAPEGPHYGTSRFSRAQFNVPEGKEATVDITDRAKSDGTYGDTMMPENSLSASVSASSSTTSVSTSNLNDGPLVDDKFIVVKQDQIPKTILSMLSEAAKKELENSGYLKLRKNCTVGQNLLKMI